MQHSRNHFQLRRKWSWIQNWNTCTQTLRNRSIPVTLSNFINTDSKKQNHWTTIPQWFCCFYSTSSSTPSSQTDIRNPLRYLLITKSAFLTPVKEISILSVFVFRNIINFLSCLSEIICNLIQINSCKSWYCCFQQVKRSLLWKFLFYFLWNLNNVSLT